MPFITQSNFNKIIGEIPIEKDLEGEIYKTPILFFNKTEKNRLLKIKEILQIGDNQIIKIYVKIERKDTQNWVFEGGQPAYHNTHQCSTLNSEYVNFPIPEEIKEKGLVKEFREWFKENSYLLESSMKNQEEIFALRLKSKFSVNLESRISRPNSGITQFNDVKLEDLEKEIDNILSKSKNYYLSANSHQKLAIKKFASRAFLFQPKYQISDNDTGLNDKELRKLLQEYDENFKQPTKDLLTKYYMVKYNPKLEFKGNLLEQLGFKKCNKCYQLTP